MVSRINEIVVNCTNFGTNVENLKLMTFRLAMVSLDVLVVTTPDDQQAELEHVRNALRACNNDLQHT